MRIRSRLLTKLATRIAVWLLRALYRTCRVKSFVVVPGTVPFEIQPPERYLFCLWHDALVSAIFARQPRHVAGLVSQHRDAEILALALELRGILPVRGSSTRGGARALRELFDVTRERHVVITTDGPLGPRREIKDGIVYLASKVGRAIVPAHATASRCWRIPAGWSDIVLPRPFATVYLIAAEPIHVPPNATREQLAAYAVRLQQAMDEVTEDAERLARGETRTENALRAAA